MVKRFEVYLINLDPQASDDPKNTRPAVIVSPDELNQHVGSVIIAPLSSTNAKYPTRIPVDFLNSQRYVILDQIRTVDKIRLVKKIGELDIRARALTTTTLQEMFEE